MLLLELHDWLHYILQKASCQNFPKTNAACRQQCKYKSELRVCKCHACIEQNTVTLDDIQE